MEIRATYRYARISALKARDVAREVTGMPVSDALDVIRFTPKKAAFLIGKTLKSAIANAEANHDISADVLVVKSATVNEGPALKRWSPAARGGASPIRKRTSHIQVILTDEGGAEAPAKAAKVNVSSKPAKKKVAKQVADAPDTVDDLKRIEGLGKKLEAGLNGIGVYTFAQIAGWTEEQAAEVDQRLGLKGRIARENWVEQAKGLAAN